MCMLRISTLVLLHSFNSILFVCAQMFNELAFQKKKFKTIRDGYCLANSPYFTAKVTECHYAD